MKILTKIKEFLQHYYNELRIPQHKPNFNGEIPINWLHYYRPPY